MSDEAGKIPSHPGMANLRRGITKRGPSKVTHALKEAILLAAEQAGGEGGVVEYLTRQAEREPAAFMSLLGRVLPLTLQGDKDNPLQVELTNASSKLRTIVEGMAERVEE